MASLIGGSSHGFAPYLSADARAAVWRATYGTLGMANLLILAAAASFALRGAAASVAVFALTVRLALYLSFIGSRPEFRYVVYDYALTLVLLTIFAVYGRQRAWPGAGWLLAGIGVSFVGALIQATSDSACRSSADCMRLASTRQPCPVRWRRTMAAMIPIANSAAPWWSTMEAPTGRGPRRPRRAC